jgi:hypothetical protein
MRKRSNNERHGRMGMQVLERQALELALAVTWKQG